MQVAQFYQGAERTVAQMAGSGAGEAGVAAGVLAVFRGDPPPAAFADNAWCIDTLHRLAWLLGVRGPAINPMLIAMNAMQLDLIQSGRQPWRELFDMMRMYEEPGGVIDDTTLRVMALTGRQLADTVGQALPRGRSARQ